MFLIIIVFCDETFNNVQMSEKYFEVKEKYLIIAVARVRLEGRCGCPERCTGRGWGTRGRW